MMRYKFHPEAADEYLESALFYERRQTGLGARFSHEVETAVAKILEAPSRWPFFEDDVRRCLTNSFPHGILYTVEGDTVIIVAVMHCSRKPGYWHDRL
jgi:toxin ParE1/3/4